jgi:chaperonin GroES
MIKPLHDKVVVTISAPKEVTKAGLIIPTTAQEKANEGVVMSVGPGILLQDGSWLPTGLKTGDKVLFQQFAGTEIQLNGEKYLILAFTDIFGILE